MAHRTEQQKQSDTTLNNQATIIPVVTYTSMIWLCSAASGSELGYQWQDVCESDDMWSLPSVTSLMSTN
jgi:hypothetical protein